jgi:hypothetical protein
MNSGCLLLTSAARMAGIVALLALASRIGGAQGTALPKVDPAVIARLNALALPEHRARWRDTSETPSYNRQRIAVLISSTWCIGGRDPRFVPALRAALRLLSEQARRDSSSFSTIGVALDWELDSAVTYLRKLADFDQWIVGQNWGNDAVVRLVWRDSTGIPSVPQLIVLERSFGMRPGTDGRPGPVPYFGPEHVVQRFLSVDAIANWVLKSADSTIRPTPLPRSSP